MPSVASKMLSTRVSQASRVLTSPPCRCIRVTPVRAVKSSPRAEPEFATAPSALDAKTTDGHIVPPETESQEVSAQSEAPAGQEADASVTETEASNKESGAPAAETPETPPEYINVDEFPYKVGDVVTGRVLFSNARGARIAMHGVKGVLGYLPKNRGPFNIRDPKEKNTYVDGGQCIPQGTTRRFKVIAVPPDMSKGGKGPLLACNDLDLEILWNRLKTLKDLGVSMRETVRVTVYGAVDRGLLVSLFGIKGFIPVSHVVKDEGQEWLARQDLEKFVGREVEVSLMVVDETKFTFTCSMTNAVSDRVLRGLRIGSLVWGTVRHMTDYGVFLSLENTFESGLLHITNVSWHRVPTIDSVFSVGDKVRAVVIGMDEGFSRLSVSTRDLEEQEGDMLADPQKVYDNAERGVQRFLEHVKKWEAEQSGKGGEQ